MATTVSAMLIVLTAAATKPQSPLRLAQLERKFDLALAKEWNEEKEKDGT